MDNLLERDSVSSIDTGVACCDHHRLHLCSNGQVYCFSCSPDGYELKRLPACIQEIIRRAVQNA